MQRYNLNPGPESLRWLGIAEKLLQTRDLVGSITFVTRARESNPRLDHADQILAIADTLIAGEKQITNNHLDWYIQSTCATSGEGLSEELNWLSNNITNKIGQSHPTVVIF